MNAQGEVRNRWLQIAGRWAAAAALLVALPGTALARDRQDLEPARRVDEKAFAPALDVPEALAELAALSGDLGALPTDLDELRELEEGAAGRLGATPGDGGPENPFERRMPRANDGKGSPGDAESSLLDDAVAQAREAAGLGGGDRRYPECGGSGRAGDCVHLPGDPSRAGDDPRFGTPLGDPEVHVGDDGSTTTVIRFADGDGGSFTRVTRREKSGSWTVEQTWRDRSGAVVNVLRQRSESRSIVSITSERAGGTITRFLESQRVTHVIGRYEGRLWMIRVPRPGQDQPGEGGRYTGPDPCFTGELVGSGACARFGAWNSSDPLRRYLGNVVQPAEDVADDSGEDDGPTLGLEAVINVPGDFAPHSPTGGGPRRPRNPNGMNPTTQPSCHQNPSLPGC